MGVSSGSGTGDVGDHVATLLHARGQRMTAPRRAVLVALLAHGGHVSAEQVVTDVTTLDSAIHRSSVYRTLEALTQVGVLQHVHLGHGGTAYHLVESPHPHAQCTGCGSVVDLPPGLLDDVAPLVEANSGFRLDLLHVALSGRCARCAAPGADRESGQEESG